MAKLKLKQLGKVLSGSLQVSGSSGLTGSFSVISGNISGSSTSTGSFGSLVVADKVQGDLTIRDSLNVNKGLNVNVNQEAAYDFRVKSQNLNRVLYTDSNKDKVGIGYHNPGGSDLSSSLHIAGDLTIDSHITASGDVYVSGNVSGSVTSTGSFGTLETAGEINASGRIYESGTSVIDHATAMAIVFGG